MPTCTGHFDVAQCKLAEVSASQINRTQINADQKNRIMRIMSISVPINQRKLYERIIGRRFTQWTQIKKPKNHANHADLRPLSQFMYKHSALTKQIIGHFYDVYNVLGYGFLENVYEKALALRLRGDDLDVVRQQPIRVYFDGVVVGEYFADLVVNDAVILELKASKTLTDTHKAQLLNYLKATDYEVGLLLNFGPEPQVIRKAYDNKRKQRD